MNINSYVKVKLTEKGFKVYKNYIDKINELNKKNNKKSNMYYTVDYNFLKCQDGKYQMSLWQLMMIFGEHITPCSCPFFENNEIQLEATLWV